MTESELVEACLKKDRSAQKQLYDRYSRQMMSVCLRYGGNVETAQDMLQEGFIMVFEKLWQYKGEGALGGWIRRVIVTSALENLRKNKKHEMTEEINDHASSMDVDPQALQDLAIESLMKLIQEMPIGYRTVFNMFAIEGFSHKEIAESLNITESTSKSQYFKAKAFLRLQLEQQENREFERRSNT